MKWYNYTIKTNQVVAPAIVHEAMTETLPCAYGSEIRVRPSGKLRVKISINETWIADGFMLSKSEHLARFRAQLRFLYSDKITVKITGKPNYHQVRIAQGY